MKVLILLSTFLFVAQAAPVINEALQNDISDFLEIIPIEKIKKIAIQHLHDDREFQAAVKYMKSPEWTGMIEELQQQPEVKELKTFLEEAGFNLDELGTRFCGFFKEVKVETDNKERSLKGFVDDVKQIIPLAKLIEAFDDKMNNSTAFKEFYEKVTSEKVHELVTKIRALPVFQKIVAEIAAMGIDLDRAFTIAYAIFGWSDERAPPQV